MDSVVELTVEREQFPKSDTFAPLRATTGFALPSKFSACVKNRQFHYLVR